MVGEIRPEHESEWAAMARVAELLRVGSEGNCQEVGATSKGRRKQRSPRSRRHHQFHRRTKATVSPLMRFPLGG